MEYEKLPLLDPTLRIGNFYQWFHEEYISYKRMDSEFIQTQNQYNIDPDQDQFCRGWWAASIPLSPEILSKNGFTSVTYISGGKYNFWNKEKDCSVNVEITGINNEILFEYKVAKDRIKALLFVHELQNLHYALKGEELINQVE